MTTQENELRERVRSQFDHGKLPKFEEATFLGAVSSFKSNMQSGNLDLVISVGPGEKYAALSVTDAPGELLLIHVQRIPGKGRLAAKWPPVKEKPDEPVPKSRDRAGKPAR